MCCIDEIVISLDRVPTGHHAAVRAGHERRGRETASFRCDGEIARDESRLGATRVKCAAGWRGDWRWDFAPEHDSCAWTPSAV